MAMAATNIGGPDQIIIQTGNELSKGQHKITTSTIIKIIKLISDKT